MGIVHRLDRDTSGCLLLARTADARDGMIPLFEAREVEKTYHVLVLGHWPRNLTRLDNPLDGLSAVSLVRVLKASHDASLLEVRIETGRTHQIRRHTAGAGFPVLGDRQYATKEVALAAARRAPRQMLHAARLAFPHPATGARVDVGAPRPDDFRDLARRLGLG